MTPRSSKDSSDMLDFGRGIGDFLGSTYEGKEATEEELAEEEIEMPQGGADRIKIEHILKRAKGELPEEETEGAVAGGPRGGSKLLAVGLVVLVIALVLAAAGGVYMFAKKNGMPKMPSFSWPFGQKGEQSGTDQPGGEAGGAAALESINVVFVAAVSEQPAGDRPVVTARVIETDVPSSDTFDATGTSATTAGRAKGVITIVNTTSRPYTFVATTRFLTPDNVLFRMDKTTDIPANGEVTTAVTADQPGPSGDMGPVAKWTIPGLPQNLQDEIYGKSAAAMTGGSGSAPSVTQADLDAAKAALTAKVKAEGEKNFGVMLAPGEKLLPDLITSSELAVEAPKAGTAVASFTMKVTLRFRAMVFPEPSVTSLLDAKLKGAVPEGGSPADYEIAQPQYTVEAYDTATERAEVRAEASVKKL